MPTIQKLSKKQIDDIVEALPPCMSPCRKVAEKLREQIQNKLRLQLSEVSMVTTPEAIEKLKTMIRMQHYNSLVTPGEPVGIRASEANSQPITQAALSAFHTAGSASSVSAGIDAIRELYNVSKERKNEFTYIHFKDKNLIFDDIIELRRTLEGVTVKDLLSIEFPAEYSKYEYENEPWWYKSYLDLKRLKLPFNREEEFDENDFRHIYLRLKFDINKLYAYNVTPYIIAKKLDMEGVICIPSPVYEGIVDVFVNANIALLKTEKETSIKNKGAALSLNLYNAPILFLQISFYPQLKDFVVSGIPGLTNILPENGGSSTYNIIKIIKTSIYDEERRSYKILIDNVTLILDGIPFAKLLNVLKMTNFEIIDTNSTYIEVRSEELEIYNSLIGKVEENNKLYTIDIGNASSSKVIKALQSFNFDILKNTKKSITVSGGFMDFKKEASPEDVFKNKYKYISDNFNKYVEDLDKKGVLYDYRTEYPEFMREYNYIFAYARGTNLIKILAHPLVDSEKTYSSNPHEILQAFGIEATRNFMIKSYVEINSASGEYVNPHHVTLLADFQTSKGMLLPITSKGVARQNTGPLAQASFEHPMEAFVDAAAFGKKENIKSTSTSIFVGKRMILGTGSFKARIDTEALEKAEEASRKYKLQNPDRFSKINDSAQKVFTKGLVNDDFIFVHSDDNEDRMGIVGVEGTPVYQGQKQPELKLRSSVPKVTGSRVKTSSFIDDILRVETQLPGEEDFKITNAFNMNPVSVVKNSISKPGLPALPKLGASQIVNLKPISDTVYDEDEDRFESYDD